MKPLSFALVLFLSLASPLPALAWWDMGHMTVASIAYDQLDPDIRAKVDALIRLNPDYGQWVAGLPVENRDKLAFVRAATWADDIKTRDDYQNGSVHSDGTAAGLNIGYADHRKHAYWHFVDLPYPVGGATPHDPESPNALTQIEAFRATLSSAAGDDLKSYDLVWLLHLVGDVHQPLHATARFSLAIPGGDAGGNAETICRSLVCGMKLHAFWDGLLGDKGGPLDAVALAPQLPVPDPAAASDPDVRHWCEESAHIAQTQVYTSAIGDGPGPFTIDAAYEANARHIAFDRVALAGARLAALLNSALK